MLRLALHLNRTTVRLHNRLHNRQAQTGGSNRTGTRLIGTGEAVKIFGKKSGAIPGPLSVTVTTASRRAASTDRPAVTRGTLIGVLASIRAGSRSRAESGGDRQQPQPARRAGSGAIRGCAAACMSEVHSSTSSVRSTCSILGSRPSSRRARVKKILHEAGHTFSLRVDTRQGGLAGFTERLRPAEHIGVPNGSQGVRSSWEASAIKARI